MKCDLRHHRRSNFVALGVSYGLHITNRYAEDSSRTEKMQALMKSTGRGIPVCCHNRYGFISLIFTPMAPIKTVGIALSGGIVVVYILTMFMVSTRHHLDLRKPKHPPLKVFDAAVDIPVKRNRSLIGFFLILVLVSATLVRLTLKRTSTCSAWLQKAATGH